MLHVCGQADVHGERPVYVASLRGHAPVVRLLAGRGADTQSPDAAGVTPLRLAVRHGRLGVAWVLLQHGGLPRPGPAGGALLALLVVALSLLALASLNAGGLHLLPRLAGELGHYAATAAVTKANSLLF